MTLYSISQAVRQLLCPRRTDLITSRKSIAATKISTFYKERFEKQQSIKSSAANKILHFYQTQKAKKALAHNRSIAATKISTFYKERFEKQQSIKSSAANKILHFYQTQKAKKALARSAKKIRILVSGLRFLGNGDYAKQAKTCHILLQAGYICKIITTSPTQTKRLESHTSPENLINATAVNIAEYNPHIFISTPMLNNEMPLAKLGVIIVGIEEYGTDSERDKIKIDGLSIRKFLSGINGLGIMLDQDYHETHSTPTQHLACLPKVYQEAIYNNDLDLFEETSDFYFGYVNNSSNFIHFMMAVLDQREENITKVAPTKKLCFYCMGKKIDLPSTEEIKNSSLYGDLFQTLKGLNISTINLKYINPDNNIIETKKITINENNCGFEIDLISGKIDHQFVAPLIHAAKETLSTGDESFAEIYSCEKVPLFYESLGHKIALRKEQLKDIFGNTPLFKRLENTVYDMRRARIHYKNETAYKGLSQLLALKKDPSVKNLLTKHLERVHKKFNFRTNFLREIKQISEEVMKLPEPAIILGSDFKSWPINKHFIIPRELILEAQIVGSQVQLKKDESNKELYELWKDCNFKIDSPYVDVFIAYISSK